VIYEIRTYYLKTHMLKTYWSRFTEKLTGRLALSNLGGHWYTEVGSLNQMVAIWPYESLQDRIEIRAKAESYPNPVWPPETEDLIVDMVSKVYLPAPFMERLTDRTIGPLYEMRMYTYPSEVLTKVLVEWEKVIERRERLSPLAGCWYTEYGGINNFVHLWAYKNFEERLRVRSEALQSDFWPPDIHFQPTRQENKLLFPAPFSPMQ